MCKTKVATCRRGTSSSSWLHKLESMGDVVDAISEAVHTGILDLSSRFGLAHMGRFFLWVCSSAL